MTLEDTRKDFWMMELRIFGFGRIANRIDALWCKDGFAEYMQGLFFDTRGGRQGFPPNVMRALINLSGIEHDERQFEEERKQYENFEGVL